MNPPNALTLGRFVMTAVMMILLASEFPFARTLALLVFGLAALTDAFDGHLARTRYGVTPFGELMDPLADKVLVCAAFVALVEIKAPGSARPLVPAWVVVLIITREFLVTGLRLLAAGEQRMIPAGAWGKHKTIWQMVALTLLLLGLALIQDVFPALKIEAKRFESVFPMIADVLVLATAAITALSGIFYFMDHRDLLHTRHSIRRG
ncbi:MAG: CDP-diacylglycerol--glycerol-3-phosphate 3-phosphatidyltransferase [Kiritimatiellae bacterium]|nr:CDP-diacylglycerol--glycerol-3-phosphate 3-phosphatidyltransferase [Kiritimatiellia bacterium]